MSNPTITFRPALPADSPAFTDLTRRSKAYWGYDEAFMAAAWEAMQVPETRIQLHHYFAIEVEGELAGVIGFMEKPDHIWLEDLFIDPPFIGQGLGKAAWAFLLEQARELGNTEIRFESDPNAREFYEHMGAEVYGENKSEILPGRVLPLMKIKLSS